MHSDFNEVSHALAVKLYYEAEQGIFDCLANSQIIAGMQIIIRAALDEAQNAERLRYNPVQPKVEGYTPQPASKKMMNLPRVCPPDFQPQWSEDAGIVTGEYQGMKMAASTSWPHAREAIRQSLWMSAELYRLGQVPKSASEK